MSSKHYEHEAPARSKRSKAEIEEERSTKPVAITGVDFADLESCMLYGTFSNLPAETSKQGFDAFNEVILSAQESMRKAFDYSTVMVRIGGKPYPVSLMTFPKPPPPSRAMPPAEIAARAKPIAGDVKGHKLAPFMFEVLDVEVHSWGVVRVHFRTLNRVHGTPLELWYRHVSSISALQLPDSEAVEREVKKAIGLAMQHELAESFLRHDGSYVEDPHPEEAAIGRREVPAPEPPRFEIMVGFGGYHNPEALRRSFVAQESLV